MNMHRLYHDRPRLGGVRAFALGLLILLFDLPSSVMRADTTSFPAIGTNLTFSPGTTRTRIDSNAVITTGGATNLYNSMTNAGIVFGNSTNGLASLGYVDFATNVLHLSLTNFVIGRYYVTATVTNGLASLGYVDSATNGLWSLASGAFMSPSIFNAWSNANQSLIIGAAQLSATNVFTGLTNQFTELKLALTPSVSTGFVALAFYGSSAIGSNYAVGDVVTVASGVCLTNATLTVDVVTYANSTIVNSGSGFTTEETVTVQGGTCMEPTILAVTVDGGSIVSIDGMVQGGQYSVVPSNPVSVSGGNGDAALNINWGIGVNLSVAEQGYFTIKADSPTPVTGGSGTGAMVYITHYGTNVATNLIGGGVVFPTGGRQTMAFSNTAAQLDSIYGYTPAPMGLVTQGIVALSAGTPNVTIITNGTERVISISGTSAGGAVTNVGSGDETYLTKTSADGNSNITLTITGVNLTNIAAWLTAKSLFDASGTAMGQMQNLSNSVFRAGFLTAASNINAATLGGEIVAYFASSNWSVSTFLPLITWTNWLATNTFLVNGVSGVTLCGTFTGNGSGLTNTHSTVLAYIVITNSAYSVTIQVPQTHDHLVLLSGVAGGSAGAGYDPIFGSFNGDTNANYVTHAPYCVGSSCGADNLFGTNGVYMAVASGYGWSPITFSVGRAIIPNYRNQSRMCGVQYSFTAHQIAGNYNLATFSGGGFWTNATPQAITSIFLRCRFGSAWTNGSWFSLIGIKGTVPNF